MPPARRTPLRPLLPQLLLLLGGLQLAQPLGSAVPAEAVPAVYSALASSQPAASRPSVNCSALDGAFLARFARNGTVLMAVADSAVAPLFAFSWMRNVMAAGIDYWVVGAADAGAQRYLEYKGVARCFRAAAGRPPEGGGGGHEYLWGQGAWGAATFRKVLAVQQAVAMGFNVVLSDVDVVWFRNPLQYFLSRPQYDVMVSTDVVHSTNRWRDEGPEEEPDCMTVLNTGTYFVRASAAGRALMADWAGRSSGPGNDQDAFNRLVRGYFADIQLPASGVCVADRARDRAALLCRNRTLVLAHLTPAVFANAYTYYVARLHEAKRVQPYSLHQVWSGYGLSSKRQRMRDIMRYHDKRSHYRQGMFLTIDVQLPKMPEGYNSWRSSAGMVQFHLTAMAFQMAQLYHGFALALALNRTLVLPPLQCYCAKHWHYLIDCVVPGDFTTRFPYTCQLGDYLKPAAVADGASVMGRRLSIRERSFLDNPRTDPQIRSSGAVLEVVQQQQEQQQRRRRRRLRQEPAVEPGAGGAAAAAGAGAGEAWLDGSTGPMQVGRYSGAWRRLQLRAGLNDVELQRQAAALQLQQHRVLHVAEPAKLFGGFQDAALQRAFDALMANLTSSWCCRTLGEVQGTNTSSSIRYSLTARGPSAAVFARWAHRPPPPPAAKPYIPAVGAAAALGGGGSHPGGGAPLLDPASLLAAGATGGARHQGGAAPVILPGGELYTAEMEPGQQGREPGDDFVPLHGGGRHPSAL